MPKTRTAFPTATQNDIAVTNSLSLKMVLNKFLSRLNQPETESLAEDESKLALAVLLVRVARSDDEFAVTEIARIDKILGIRYGLTPQGSQTLRQKAEEIEQEVCDNVRFTRTLKQAVPLDERVGLVEALWEVALADEHRDYTEDGFLRLVCKLLGVNDRDSAFARQRVIAQMS